MECVKVLTESLVLSMLGLMDNTFTLPVLGYGTEPDTQVLLDQRDRDYFSAWEWRLTNGYAARYETVEDGSYRKAPAVIYLHRAVMQSPPGDVVVDHINRDRLDCRRENLRLVSRAVNNVNRGPRPGKRFVGVTLDKNRQGKQWVAQIASQGTGRTIGRFSTEEEAAWAYDTVARVVHGVCHLNFPDREPMPGIKIPDFSKKRGRLYVDYPGVTFDKRRGLKRPWMAFYYDKKEKRTKHLGMFSTPEAAAAVARHSRENQCLE